MNRITMATVLGLIAGMICMLGGWSLGVKMTLASVLFVLLNRTVLGFVIGVSSLRMHWAWHGALMGIVVGSIFSYSIFLMGEARIFVVGTIVGSIVFGLLIEFITTVVFNHPQVLVTTEVPARKKAAVA